MTSRERVLAAARRQPTDRTPLMLWIEPHTLVRIAQKTVRPKRLLERAFFDGLGRLRDELPTEQLRNGAPLLAYLLQTDYLIELGADLVDFYWGFLPAWMKKLRLRDGNVFITDMYGIERNVTGIYFEAVGYPCKTKGDLDRYKFPDLSHPIHYEHIRQFRKRRPNMAISAWAPGVQDWSQGWHGMENIYAGMVEYPDVIERFFLKMARHSLQIIRGGLRAGADIVMIADDYGGQDNLMISKKMWERFVFPCLKMQCDEIHRLGGVAMLHSCGSVAPLLDKLVEAGVDMLHPFQPTGKNNLAEAKKEFGDRLCFVTGIDVQKIATFTPEQTRESIIESARIGGEGGGLVLSPTNFLQEDTPEENLRAMFDAIAEVCGQRPRAARAAG